MRSLRVYIIVVAALLIVYVVAQYNRPDAINWSQTYDIHDKTPFGTYIIYNRLNDIFPKAKIESLREPIYNAINDHQKYHFTYFIICGSLDPNEYDYQKLKKFIASGNDVFISAGVFGEQMDKDLKISTEEGIGSINGGNSVKFVNKSLDTTKSYNLGKGIGSIYFGHIDTSKAVVLGTNKNGEATFIKYQIGKGNLFLNANPLMFTNFSLLNKNGADYAAKALSYVKNDHILTWDQYYAVGREDDGSEMRVFLRHDALRWTFYIAFISLVLYVLYEIKRRQRVIPIIEPLENTTLGFVNVVGQVYYEHRDNLNISSKKITYFLEYLRSNYNLKTNPLDEEFIDSFYQKTGIERSFAKSLTEYISYMGTQTEVTDRELIKLNHLIEQFYTQTR